MRITRSTMTIPFTLLVLCGGRGLRMGGEDKPLLSWRNTTLVDAVVASAPDRTATLISANRNQARYAARGDTFADADVDAGLARLESPLVGILGGLRRCPTEWLLVAPGDTPLLAPGWYEPLAAVAEQMPNVPGAVTHDGYRQQHLHALLNVRLEPSLAHYLATGRRAVHGWLAAAGVRPVAVDHPEWFVNVNAPGDLPT